jgi:hypothetical protein
MKNCIKMSKNIDSKNDTVDSFLKKIDYSMYEDKNRKLSEGVLADRRRKIVNIEDINN